MTLEEFTRFYQAKISIQQCHSCGETHWGVPGLGDYDQVANLMLSKAPEEPGTKEEVQPNLGAQPVVYMGCLNCGFVRLYSYDFVTDWLRDNPAKDAEQGNGP